MATAGSGFRESNIGSVPIRDLGLTIAGTELEPTVRKFEREVERAGFRLKPVIYLSTEWGVNFGTIAIGVPFYLARPELVNLHAEQTGHLEGTSKADLLRYLRHEFGHVLNYAYRLYDRADWTDHFGSMTQPYLDDFRPEPFSRRYVRHLPGWYAQKHPDEDWSETFAVWMSPRSQWRKTYAEWPEALRKLEFCAKLIEEIKDRDPVVKTVDMDDDVAKLPFSLDQFYQNWLGPDEPLPPGLDGMLLSIFEDWDKPEDDSPDMPRKPAAELIHQLESALMDHVYRWTGHFPERTRRLLRHLADRAGQLQQVYPEDKESAVTIALSTAVTALAMNYVHRGSYLP